MLHSNCWGFLAGQKAFLAKKEIGKCEGQGHRDSSPMVSFQNEESNCSSLTNCFDLQRKPEAFFSFCFGISVLIENKASKMNGHFKMRGRWKTQNHF